MESQTSYIQGKTSSGVFKFLSIEVELVDGLYYTNERTVIL